MLTKDMKRVIAEQQLGFVATVNVDGTPNLSPKATTRAIDDEHIAFADIRSPATMANIAARPAMEINFVDPFARKGYRFKGTARIVPRGTPEFETILRDHYAGAPVPERYRAFVVLHVTKAAPLISPAYDSGSTEPELRRSFRTYFDSIQPKSQ
jgi:predicted pyridoxine 5'-phosphate oxidase superfamily flavin-nucleotide-binding protein